jgi:hypothetical protein
MDTPVRVNRLFLVSLSELVADPQPELAPEPEKPADPAPSPATNDAAVPSASGAEEAPRPFELLREIPVPRDPVEAVPRLLAACVRMVGSPWIARALLETKVELYLRYSSASGFTPSDDHSCRVGRRDDPLVG